MKIANGLVMGMALLGFSALETNAGAPVVRQGTSVLHYLVQGDFATTDLGSNVAGVYRLQFNEQGHSQKQSLDVRFAGLDTNATYDLTAVLGADTNVVDLAPLVSDGKGRVRVSYRAHGPASLHGHAAALPAPLTLLTDVQALGLDNAATQNVAYVWVANAPKFQLLVKRNLTPADTNGTAVGSLSLIANARHVNFRLRAGGLNPTNDYHLALNSNIVSSVQSGPAGMVEFRDWPADAPAVLDLRLLQVLDAGSNAVLSTTLPR